MNLALPPLNLYSCREWCSTLSTYLKSRACFVMEWLPLWKPQVVPNGRTVYISRNWNSYSCRKIWSNLKSHTKRRNICALRSLHTMQIPSMMCSLECNWNFFIHSFHWFAGKDFLKNMCTITGLQNTEITMCFHLPSPLIVKKTCTNLHLVFLTRTLDAKLI